MSAIKRFPAYLHDIQEEVEGYAKGFGLDFFPIIYEVLDYKTMNEVAAYGGFPTRYPHWRFGMDYEQLSKSYEWGLSKIYEMVINTNPAYAYLLEGNSLVDQKIVMAHVCAHVDFFKNNYFFSKTNRKMIDGMANHAARVRRHMSRHGQDTVEDFIDTCLSLENLIDPMSAYIVRSRETKPNDGADEDEPRDRSGRLRAKGYMESFINPPEYLEAQKKKREEEAKRQKRRFPEQPQRDVVQFLIEHAPLDHWQTDVLEIVNLCDRVAVMYSGRIAEIGPVQDLVRNPLHPYAKGLMGAIPTLAGDNQRLVQIPGSMPRLSAIPPGCPFNPRCASVFDRCRVERPEPLQHDTQAVACHLYDTSVKDSAA